MATRKKRHTRHQQPTKKRSKPKPLTGNPIRDLSFVAWKNNAAHLETMRGSQWKRALAKERTFWNALVKRAHITMLQKTMEKELTDAAALTSFNYLTLGNGTLQIQVSSGANVTWKWAWSNRAHYVSDLDFWDNKVFYVTDDEKDRYVSNLVCQDAGGHNIWIKKNISGQVAIKDGLCYYISVVYPFNTVNVVCCDAATGKHQTVLLNEPSEERFLNLVTESNKTLYFKSTSWTDTKTWRIEGRRIYRVQEDTLMQYPLGFPVNSDDECGFIIKKGDNKWTPYGSLLCSWDLPKEDPVWVNLQSGHIMTIKEGRTTLYLCQPHKKSKPIHTIRSGDFTPNPYAKWHAATFQSFSIYTPDEIPYVLFVGNQSDIGRKWRPVRPIKPEFYKEFDELVSTVHHATSEDGTRVPYLMVKNKKVKKPRAILCYIYSSYGSTTNVAWPHIGWSPLLRRGFAIIYCYARGGGDMGYSWMKAGQADRHIKTVEDFEATIRSAQKLTGLSSKRTIIYGRSAGGMMVGATVLRNPTGALMGGVFTEVPFTDLLRTQTNMTISLSPSGISEFGNAIGSPVNFQSLLDLSIMESLPEAGAASGLFVLCRTGLRDLQVLPYEPVKFIQRLRGKDHQNEPNNKYLSYEKDETHSYSFKTFVKTRATDLALLLRFIENKI
jgi:Prolyl oligopeptidase family